MGHRFVEHVGEVEVELEADSERGVFAAALEAFAELVGGGRSGDEAVHDVELAGEEPALLLVDWLTELVFLAETEQFAPERIERFELAAGRLRATVAGRLARPRPLVKAVTLSRLELGEADGRWRGRVVLDV